MSEVYECVKNLGFPIFIACYLLVVQGRKLDKLIEIQKITFEMLRIGGLPARKHKEGGAE